MSENSVIEDKKKNIFLLYLDQTFAKYVDFKNTTSRKDYWITVAVFFMILLVPGFLADLITQVSPKANDIVMEILAWFVIISFIPFLSLTVRRIKDTGLTGWFVLLGLIPTIGWIFIFIVTLLPTSVKVKLEKEELEKINRTNEKSEKIKAKEKIINPDGSTTRLEHGINITVVDKKKEK